MNAKVIAVSCQKGGIGKTTTTFNLAACISMRVKPVLVIDLDPQGSLSDWVYRMDTKATKLFDHIRIEEDDNDTDVLNAINDNREKYEYIIIDCPPRLGKKTGYAIREADLIVSACGLGEIEKWAFDDFNELIGSVDIPSYVFLSKVNPTWKKLIREAKENLEKHGFKNLQTINEYACITEAPKNGKCTIHMNHKKASMQIEQLTTDVMGALNE